MTKFLTDSDGMANSVLTRAQAAEGAVRRYHVMVKPIGSLCNLDCTYCYYLHKEQLLGSNSNFRMSDEVLETHIRQYIEGQDGDEVVFSWQGGEPTLLGLLFFEKVMALEQKYKRAGQRIENDLQTNGILLDDEWCRFLKTHRFLVGLSIDGPEELHNAYRRSKGGQPTFKKVFAASELLPVHNDTWNDGEEIGASDFIKRLVPAAIQVWPSGDAEISFGDGDLFWGHEVGVRYRGGVFTEAVVQG